jgi:CHAT domain-containing protein/Tfp pilus assembly protein PilF
LFFLLSFRVHSGIIFRNHTVHVWGLFSASGGKLKRAKVVLAAAVLGLAASAQVALPANHRVEAHLEPGRNDSYSLDLTAEQYIEIKVEQPGADVTLALAAPDGTAVNRVNFLGRGGTELLFHVAQQAGRYSLEIGPAHEGEGGVYAVVLETIRPASPNDVALAAADARLRSLIAESSDSGAGFEGAASEFERLGAKQRQAVALTEAAVRRYRHRDNDPATADAEKALALWRSLGDRAGEGRVLTVLGSISVSRNIYNKATSYDEQALAIARELGNTAIEASALESLARVYTLTGEPGKAVESLERVILIRRTLRDRAGEASALADLAYSHFALTHHEVAVGYYEQALAIARAINDRLLESEVLNGIGIVYRELGRYDEAIQTYERALEIERALKDRKGEGVVLGNLGVLYTTVGQYEKALACHEQALASARQYKDRLSEGVEIGFIGYTYRLLGQYDAAIRYYEQGLAFARELHIRVGEGMALNELGDVYSTLGQYQKAISTFEQALAIERQIKNRAVEGWVLNNLGNAYLHLNQPAKAIGYYQQSLTIAREIKDRAKEAESLNNLGLAYLATGQLEDAIAQSEQALVISRQVKNRNNEHDALLALMRIFAAQGQYRLAVFYGKQAVNVVQSIRADIRGLSQDSRSSFVNSKKDTYRTLANLLVIEGRLFEAQQVLTLLKEHEFLDYLRGSDSRTAALGRADLTADESEWAERYRSKSEVLVAKGAELEDLRTKIRRQPALREAPETLQQLSDLQKDIEAGNLAFQGYLAELKQHFAEKPGPASTLASLRESEALKADLGELKHGAVAVYTLLAPDRYVAILVTPRVQRAYESKITPEALNQKILAFREVLENPRSNPLPIAEDLYHILIPPALAADLKQARAKTLMWSLDGPLRYLPVAALYDGRHYLIEDYQCAVFTPASKPRLKDVPQANWRGLAFGVTQSHPGFEPLPEVAAELQGIIREKPGEEGVLEGRRLLDERFTRASLDQELSVGYPVVHFASHFQFRPGDETRSFLLLGDGGQLTLADLKAADIIFAGVDLLTLSACSTGVGSTQSSDGSEVEGFGALAQNKGAKSVVATLWSVADTSTAILMREFYRTRQRKPGLTKVEALREAQLALLRGTANPIGGSAERGVIVEPGNKPSASRSLRMSTVSSYAHPYYWAAFFLMGNWL